MNACRRVKADPDIQPFTTADVAGLSVAKAEPETQQKNAASAYVRNRKGVAGVGAGSTESTRSGRKSDCSPQPADL